MTNEERTTLIDSIYYVDEKVIYGFFKEHRFLSNYHLCPIEYEGLVYNSTESAFQAAKTTDIKIRESFIKASLLPHEAKIYGRKIRLREDWDKVKDDIMTELLVIKFNLSGLGGKLLSTGDRYLEETNYWGDTYWGADISHHGENKLGKTLMRVREMIKL